MQNEVGLSLTLDNGRVIAVGTIDAETCPSLRKALLDPPTNSVVVNMAGVEFLDSSGLRELIEARDKLRRDRGTLTIESPSRPVRRLLSLTGLAEQFGVDADGGDSEPWGRAG